MLEVDDIMLRVTETNMKEYTRRVKKFLTSKLKGANVIKAIKSWVVSLLRYSGGVINWTNNEHANLDRKTRKLVTMRGALYPRSNVSRLYLPRREGAGGLISV